MTSHADLVGLCRTCMHACVVAHPRGGDPYWQCSLAAKDRAFPRYPRLPVQACRGYERDETPR